MPAPEAPPPKPKPPVPSGPVFSVTSRLWIPLDECELTFARSSGPGGQNVNKVNSKALLRWHARANQSLPEDVRRRLFAKVSSQLTVDGDLLISSQRYRDQPRNIDDCWTKLRELVMSVSVAPIKRRPTKPSRASKERRLEAKRTTGEKKRNRGGVERE